MLRRLRTLYSGVRALRINDTYLTYDGTLPRDTRGIAFRQELNTAQVRLPRA